MKKRVRLLVVLLTLLCWYLPTHELRAQWAAVWGTITNASGHPVPGVTVSLFHPAFGRSYPSMTDLWGRYVHDNVPIHPAPYFIEVYWGPQLIYRGQIQLRAPMQWDIQIR